MLNSRILRHACFLVGIFTICVSEEVSEMSHFEEDKKQLILYPPATKTHRQPSTMLVYGQQEGSGQDSEVDKETVDSIANNVLALSSLVKAQSEVIENLSREVAELREKLREKEEEKGQDKSERKIEQMEQRLQIDQVSIAKLGGDSSKVQERITKMESVVKKMLEKLEDKFDKGDEKLKLRLKGVESHVESLYELQRTTAEAVAKDEWPQGHYCILAKGKCPSGFRRHEGHLKSLYLYSQHEQFLKEAEFGSSYIGCFGKYCGEYGNFIGSIKIVSCCK